MKFLGGLVVFLLIVGNGYTAFAQDPEPLPPPSVKEAEIATYAARAANGKLVRMVEVIPDKEAEVKDSNIGRIVEIDNLTIPPNALCHVILDAPVLKARTGANTLYQDMPDIPELEGYWYIGDHYRPSRPVQMLESKNVMGYYRWSVLFRGDVCVAVAVVPGYVGSTIMELEQEALVDKARTLKIDGTCTRKGIPHDCKVPYGHKDAMVQGVIHVPYEWSKRSDLNFIHAQWDDTAGKYETDRTEVAKKELEDQGVEVEAKATGI